MSQMAVYLGRADQQAGDGNDAAEIREKCKQNLIIHQELLQPMRKLHKSCRNVIYWKPGENEKVEEQ